MRSSLGTLLESGESGLHLLEGDVDPDMVRLQSVARGYQFIDFDGRPASGKPSLMDQAARAFDLPPHFGANWDALADCVMDLSWTPGLRWVVLVRGLERLYALDPESYRMTVDILEEAAQFWADQEQPFIVLLTADCGPATLDLPAIAFV